MKVQEIKSNKQSKYEEIIEFLKQNNRYWLDNDIWDLTEEFFVGNKVNGYKYIDFSCLKNDFIKNSFKYYLLFTLKNRIIRPSSCVLIFNVMKSYEKYIGCKTNTSITDLNVNEFKLYLLNCKFAKSTTRTYWQKMHEISNFLKNYYDDREETEKDIWKAKNIIGVRVCANQERKSKVLDFTKINIFYREIVKKYLRTIVTKKSFNHCINILNALNEFFQVFYYIGYKDGFIRTLSREDIEKYLFNISLKHNKKTTDYWQKFISYPKMFLEYIQIAQYAEAPLKEVAFLIFEDDIPTRERDVDRLNRIKFIPEPILKELDNNIMDLGSSDFIPIYILLRESGWRGTDILNLRFHNCLEQIWNSKEKTYNHYLCGEITKTGIAQLKIPIRDKVAEMVQKSIDKAKELSNDDDNNPNKYLFNNYEGKLKGTPLSKQKLLYHIKKLIEEKDIRDVTGELYHFRLHSLRHTRAKEFVEQGVGISIIQQMLGHQSLQMTVHYATVTENVLYEKWKNTEDLELFKVDIKTNDLEKVDLSSDAGENLIRYEYVRKNLDAVRVPFGVCFKPDKFICKQQMNHCLNCGSFCTTTENIPEYEEEIEHVKKQIDISERCGRELWAEKNKTYLRLLEDTLTRIKEQKVIHKNGKSRENN